MSTPKQTEQAGAPGGRSVLRAAAAIALVSTWLVALFVGWVAGGLAHLLLVAALVTFPWRVAVRGEDGVPFAPVSNQEREPEETR